MRAAWKFYSCRAAFSFCARVLRRHHFSGAFLLLLMVDEEPARRVFQRYHVDVSGEAALRLLRHSRTSSGSSFPSPA